MEYLKVFLGTVVLFFVALFLGVMCNFIYEWSHTLPWQLVIGGASILLGLVVTAVYWWTR